MAMNTDNNAAHINALSDNQLDAVAGGERHQVTKEQFDTLNMVRMVVAGTYVASTNPNDKW
jgi:hypothetical protein